MTTRDDLGRLQNWIGPTIRLRSDVPDVGITQERKAARLGHLDGDPDFNALEENEI